MVSGNSTRSLSFPTEPLSSLGLLLYYYSINPSPRASSSEIIQQFLACPCSHRFPYLLVGAPSAQGLFSRREDLVYQLSLLTKNRPHE